MRTIGNEVDGGRFAQVNKSTAPIRDRWMSAWLLHFGAAPVWRSRSRVVFRIASVSGNVIGRSCFRILLMSCDAWSADVHRRTPPSRAVVTQLVTRSRDSGLTTWMRTMGENLIAVERCSLARMWVSAQGGRSAHALLYLAAVLTNCRKQETVKRLYSRSSAHSCGLMIVKKILTASVWRPSDRPPAQAWPLATRGS